MSMQVQDGKSVVAFAEANIANAVGKAVIYGSTAKGVVEGTADAPNFAGIIATVTAGKSAAATGDSLTINKKGFCEAIASGPILYGQPVALDAGGKMKAIPVHDSVPTVALMSSFVGRAQKAAAADGDVFIVSINVE